MSNINMPSPTNLTTFVAPDPGSIALPDGITTNMFILMKQIGDLLWQHYPGHQWIVEPPKGGVVVIRHGLIGARHGWGYVLHVKDFSTWDALRDRVILAGGELMERANIRRGPVRDSDDAPKHIDGLPDKHQPQRKFFPWKE